MCFIYVSRRLCFGFSNRLGVDIGDISDDSDDSTGESDDPVTRDDEDQPSCSKIHEQAKINNGTNSLESPTPPREQNENTPNTHSPTKEESSIGKGIGTF